MRQKLNTGIRAAIYLVILLLAGCATSYQPKGLTGGFSEIQIAEGTYQITFEGNAYTDKRKTIDFTLLRSAEITLENGYRYFVITDSGAERDYRQRDRVLHASGAVSFIVKKPSASNTIICFREDVKSEPDFYDAKYVAESIRKKYGIGGY
ncbi:MAG: hypothetical protein OXE42_11985 [Gammaproteobacteria bacterium]|nr:hypothetical protein [Gammaproteobacteria bacterium]